MTVPYETNNHTEHGRDNEPLYSKRLKAGKRRTYFFDVRATRGNDYFLTITESKKRFNDDGYDRHKIFLYKEDFNKFISALTDAVDHVKTELLPDFDFDSFSHDDYEQQHDTAENGRPQQPQEVKATEAGTESETETETETETVSSSAPEAPVESGEASASNEEIDVKVDKW